MHAAANMGGGKVIECNTKAEWEEQLAKTKSGAVVRIPCGADACATSRVPPAVAADHTVVLRPIAAAVPLLQVIIVY